MALSFAATGLDLHGLAQMPRVSRCDDLIAAFSCCRALSLR